MVFRDPSTSAVACWSMHMHRSYGYNIVSSTNRCVVFSCNFDLSRMIGSKMSYNWSQYL